MPQPRTLLLIGETIAGVLVFVDEATRTQARNAIETYLARPRAGVATTPELMDQPAGKYGAGPTLLVRVAFLSLADANEAWATAVTFIFPALIPDSQLDQYTSTSDDEHTINTTVYQHQMHVPARPEDF
jgi:hypothetical protein